MRQEGPRPDEGVNAGGQHLPDGEPHGGGDVQVPAVLGNHQQVPSLRGAWLHLLTRHAACTNQRVATVHLRQKDLQPDGAAPGRVTSIFGSILKMDSDDPDGSEEVVLEENEPEEDDEHRDLLDEGFGEQPDGSQPQAPLQLLLTPPRRLLVTRRSSSGPTGPPVTSMWSICQRLVELCRKGYVSNAEAEEIVGLWQNLLEVDKGSVAYPSRYKDSLMKGRFKKSKTSAPGPAGGGEHETLRGGKGERSRLLPPGGGGVQGAAGQQEGGGVLISQWSLVLRDYNTIRSVVVSHPALKTRSSLQLFAVNQATLSVVQRICTAEKAKSPRKSRICIN
ncbi:uncharacterized protein LOC106950106 [Poecilia latipinna]|uniref:uncharacterized protein LOC106950106 n=1 Tax=Poecilia latipinna TaxID=48699 RepID=UPI00072E8F70|nr:PREDICTED: uncharacterized protein LOC106950106 [Poecilia latipinna]